MTARPLPVPDEISAPYWAAAAGHVLAIARCARCGSFALPPDQACPHCGSTDPDYAFEPVSGRGTVRSWTVIRQSGLPGFAAEVPFVLVDVELAEQPELRMIGRLLDGPAALDGVAPGSTALGSAALGSAALDRVALDSTVAPLRLGAPVRVGFEDVAPGVAIPAFTLTAAARPGEEP
ncbi:hypothetical protein Ga0074812_11034 [Parafrankia irregularis]|uniref:DUF35 domain-containing protein n=1 Tax=Parafrankia irregularis TaxID=795642 RepID=A0A0S4QMW8_9ACTN|nr:MULTISPECIES: OB-fold domain-containing protein [Parafrankia]MBE3206097.1 OB-fold domain-containing protein [Parafrankia sp. CH37]CUU57019.1 hypothetical protein Ga0074812_11034 [Parafrankia irregularis]